MEGAALEDQKLSQEELKLSSKPASSAAQMFKPDDRFMIGDVNLTTLLAEICATEHNPEFLPTSETVPEVLTTYQGCVLYILRKDLTPEREPPISITPESGLQVQLKKLSQALSEILKNERRQLFEALPLYNWTEYFESLCSNLVSEGVPVLTGEERSPPSSPKPVVEVAERTTLVQGLRQVIVVMKAICEKIQIRIAASIKQTRAESSKSSSHYEDDLKVCMEFVNDWKNYNLSAWLIDTVTCFGDAINTLSSPKGGSTFSLWEMLMTIFVKIVYLPISADLGYLLANSVEELLRLQVAKRHALKTVRPADNIIALAPVREVFRALVDMEVTPDNVVKVDQADFSCGYRLDKIKGLLLFGVARWAGEMLSNSQIPYQDYTTIIESALSWIRHWLTPFVAGEMCRKVLEAALLRLETMLQEELRKAGKPEIPCASEKTTKNTSLRGLMRRLQKAGRVESKHYICDHCPTLCNVYEDLCLLNKKHNAKFPRVETFMQVNATTQKQ